MKTSKIHKICVTLDKFPVFSCIYAGKRPEKCSSDGFILQISRMAGESAPTGELSLYIAASRAARKKTAARHLQTGRRMV